MQKKIYVFSFALIFLGYVASVSADAPLEPPTLIEECTKSKAICAVSDPNSRKTIAFEKVSNRQLWSVDSYLRFFKLSNDGRSIVNTWDGNLAPVNISNDYVLAEILRDGLRIRSIMLKDLYSDKSELLKTASHLAWVIETSISDQDTTIFTLVDGRKATFSLLTGQQLP